MNWYQKALQDIDKIDADEEINEARKYLDLKGY